MEHTTATNPISTIEQALLKALFSIQEKYKKPYTFPSQLKLLQLLATYSYISISRRTLNYKLRHLQDGGYIARRRRIKRNPDGTLCLATSLYFLTKRAYSYLKGLCRWAHAILKRRPSWAKQIVLPDHIADIQQDPDEVARRTKYLNLIYQICE